jgi:hypothetical protein
MTMRLGRLFMAALAALMTCAMFARGARDGSNYAGYSQFRPCLGPPPEVAPIVLQHMEVIAINRRNAPSEIKVHSPERPNRPIRALGSNCYVGSRRDTDHFHEQIQLRDPIV